MKKAIILSIALLSCINLRAWWDPGHLVVAMIAYMQMEEQTRQRVDELTKNLERDYPAVNHFVVTGSWPDDLKAEGVRAYDTWHYTNIPYNRDGVVLPPQPEIDVIWAINQAVDILGNDRSREVDKARFLAFLVHFVGDLHQPLHSTTMYTNELPGGNRGGNEFSLKGQWRNLHMLWDDGCGYLSPYNDIRPYGEPYEPLTSEEIERIKALAQQLTKEFPRESFYAVEEMDPRFWALESHRLAVRYGYRGINDEEKRGWSKYIQPGQEPSDYYLNQGQRIVRQQLALAGYRLGALLDDIFRVEKNKE